jgi:intracellular multiplication protein IcmP
MPQAQSGQGGGDDSLAPLYIIVLLVVVSMIVWYFNHTIIVRLMFKLNIWQSELINLIWPGEPLAPLIQLMQALNPELVDWNSLLELTLQVGLYMRYIFGVILFILAFFLFQKDLSLKYAKVHSMKTLRAQEQENWPSIAPVIKQDLVNTDIDEGPWAMALNPIEFAKKNKLLKKSDALVDSSQPGTEFTAGLKKMDAKRVFTMQLGPLWESFDKCQPHVKAMAAIFLARINRDKDAADKIASALSRSFAVNKIDYKEAYPVIAKYQNVALVQEIVQGHAYVYTVLASLLEAARDDGVVPSSDFLWLKPVDRRLWYMLNCVGRQTPFAEISGAFAHWKAEKVMQRPCLTPMTDEAVKALELAIKEVKLSAKELQELSV